MPSHPLFENVDHILQMLRQYVSFHNVRGSVHNFVLVSQLGIDANDQSIQYNTKIEKGQASTLYNE
jgi:hypothetical protein